MEPTSYRDLIEQLLGLGPFQDTAQAEAALSAFLKALCGRLMPEERKAIAGALPDSCAHMLLGAQPLDDGGLFGVIHDIAQAEHIALGRAAEHADIVSRVIVGLAGDAARVPLRRAVPELAALLEAPVPTSLEVSASARRTLASGDPAVLAHRHSVARSDDPHGDSKLSSARGLMQERDEDTLASGRPGSRRPISSSR